MAKKPSVQRALMQEFAKARGQGRGVFIGIVPGTAAHPGDSASLAEIAMWNHEGTDTIPARPFLRIALSAQRPEVQQMVQRVSQLVLKGKLTLEQGLRLLGEWGRAEVVKTINEGVDPAITLETVARKGSSQPLVDTAQLKSSITYVLKDLGENE